MNGRFAPSPTGDLHLGNLRTALVAWLCARATGGRFVVRMEDLDRVTSSPHHEARQLADLDTLGLDWDGPVVRQSERFDRYDAALARLEADDRTYPCFCTRREIAEATAAPHGDATGRYPGTCRDLDHRGRSQRAATRPAAIRLRADDVVEAFDDGLLGHVEGRPDDVVLRRNDGVPAYHLAVVVDDEAQDVEEVVRGDDLAAVTPSQVHLGRLLGFRALRYLHVPLVLGPDGQRLAKRHGSVTLAGRIATGDTPAAVVSLLARSLGIDAPPEVRPTELTARWDPTSVPRAPWTLDESVVGPGDG